MKNTGRNVRLHQQYRRKKRKRRKKRVLTEAVFLMAAISVVCFGAILIVLFFADDPGTSTKLRTAAENGHSESVVPDSENHVFPEINIDLEHLYSRTQYWLNWIPERFLRSITAGTKFIPLPSGAECCMAFADRIAGSEEAFVDMMNEKAAEMGMKNTHFCNATGLHDPDHYSTVKDISVLLRYALQYEDFRQAFSSSRYTTQPTNLHPDGFTFLSTMFRYMDSAGVVGGEIIGGKTGYTEEAGLCLASLAEVSGKEYILVTAKAKGTHRTEQFHILDAVDVYSQIGESGITNEGRSENGSF